MDAAAGHGRNAKKYIVVYLIILAIAALQFVIAYSDISASQMLARMLILAVVEASLGLLYFMHLADNRGLLWFVAIFTVFVMLAMQFGWSDSFRLAGGVPWAK
jgi:heme/copper-type cytochrome/quinol oxidase subunit 4